MYDANQKAGRMPEESFYFKTITAALNIEECEELIEIESKTISGGPRPFVYCLSYYFGPHIIRV